MSDLTLTKKRAFYLVLITAVVVLLLNMFYLVKRTTAGPGHAAFIDRCGLHHGYPYRPTTVSPTSTTNESLPSCAMIPQNLSGPITLLMDIRSYTDIANDNPGVGMGGHYVPTTCKPVHKIAILIPYRDRESHLKILLNNLHPFLRRQLIDYTIHVVEMEKNIAFNRGLLLNAGFAEAMKIHKYDCVILHDVDLIPEDDRNLYTCPDVPRHMSAAMNKFRYQLPYLGYFGGVSAMRSEHYRLVNGFSNKFFGWGGEDDNLFNRIEKVGLPLSRYLLKTAKYTMLRHAPDHPNPNRFKLMKNDSMKLDGLSTLKYTVLKKEFKTLYTWILIHANRNDYNV